MPDKKIVDGSMSSDSPSKVNSNEISINVLSYIAIKLGGVPEALTKINELGLRFSTGFIKDTSDTQVLDTIIHHQKYPHMVIGIKTMIRPPYFKFVWKLRQDYDEVMEINEVESINDAYQAVYQNLVDYFPCLLVNAKVKPYKIIYDDGHNVFVVDLKTYKGAIYNKLAMRKVNFQPLNRGECIQDTEEVKFSINGVILTVKNYVQSRYLIEFFKLFKIIHYAQNST
jgi:hypothetical protein